MADTRGNLELHELTLAFPGMAPDEFAGLKASIERDGQEEPIVLYEGKIIDGRHRYRACVELGIEPITREFGSRERDGDSPERFVLRHNIQHRSLQQSKRVVSALKVVGDLTDAQEQNSQGSSPLFSRKSLAAELGVDIDIVSEAYRIREKSKKVFDAIHQGDITLYDANRANGAGVTGAALEEALDNVGEDKRYKLLADAITGVDLLYHRTPTLTADVRSAIKQGRLSEFDAMTLADEPDEVQSKALACYKQLPVGTFTLRTIADAVSRHGAIPARVVEILTRTAVSDIDTGMTLKDVPMELVALYGERDVDDSDIVSVYRALNQQRNSAIRIESIISAFKRHESLITLTAAVRELQRQEARKEAESRAKKAATAAEVENGIAVGRQGKIFFTDNMSREKGIPSLADESVALVFTSPPYWDFVEYPSEGIGTERSYDEYLASLQSVFSEIQRTIMPGGRVVVNASNMKSKKDNVKKDDDAHSFIYPIVSDIINTMTNIGFVFFDEMIWHKGEANAGALGGAPLWGSYPYPPTPKMLDSTFENILVFTKQGTRITDPGTKELSALELGDWREYTKGIWSIPPDKDPIHPATFPIEIAERVIRLYSFADDVVLDPFAGSGTTIIAADKWHRQGVGFEIAPSYLASIQEKVNKWLT